MSASYDEKTKKWFCTFKYKDWTGKTRKTTKRGFARKKDAIAYEVNFKASSQGTPSMTLEALAEKYLSDYKVNRKISSYLTVKNRICKYITAELGALPISEITPLTIKEWQNRLAVTGISQSMIRSINVSFSAMMNFAVKYFNCPSNPFQKTGKTGKIRKKIDFLEVDEFMKLESVIDNAYDKLVFSMLFWSGMRIGELEALTAEDIDFDSNTISIRRTYLHAIKVMGPPKTSYSIRNITMPEFMMKDIKEYLDSLPVQPEYPFMLHPPTTMRARLTKYTSLAGVSRITLHDLRHSHASYLIQQGVAITAISKRLGHSSPAITLNIYAHVYKDNDTEIAQMIEKDFKRASKTP